VKDDLKSVAIADRHPLLLRFDDCVRPVLHQFKQLSITIAACQYDLFNAVVFSDVSGCHVVGTDARCSVFLNVLS